MSPNCYLPENNDLAGEDRDSVNIVDLLDLNKDFNEAVEKRYGPQALVEEQDSTN